MCFYVLVSMNRINNDDDDDNDDIPHTRNSGVYIDSIMRGFHLETHISGTARQGRLCTV